MISIENLDKLINETTNRIKLGEDCVTIRNDILGRSGNLNTLLKTIGTVNEGRGEIGAYANKIKHKLEEILALTDNSSTSADDLTLPPQTSVHGHEHPIKLTIAELYKILGNMGFQIFTTPEIERESDNFDFLRLAKDHPARDMQDTFWTKDGHVLRTQTTAFQKRVLSRLKPPFAVMQAGRIYRAEAEDATHLSVLYQIDIFAVKEGLSFANLKGVLFEMMKQFLGPETEIRFRPSFFPFVEPGAEMDVRCAHCKGKGCRACGHKGWLELLGCGMSHPEIITAGGLDPDKYTGIAFGVGVERLAMVKYGVTDIREFTRNDPRFLEQIC